MPAYNPTGYDNNDPYNTKKKKKKSPLRRQPEETVTTATAADVAAARGQQADTAPRRSDTELNPRDIINYRRAGAVLTDPNRTVEDVQRAVAERVKYGNAVRGASDYEQYRDADSRGNLAAAPTAVNQQNITVPPNLASPEDIATARNQRIVRDVGQGITGFAKNVGGFIKDAYQSNDPGYFTEPAYRSENVPSIVKAGVRAVDTAGRAASRFVQDNVVPPVKLGYNALENYGETGKWGADPELVAKYQDPVEQVDLSKVPAPFAALGDKLNPSLAREQQSNTLLGRTGISGGSTPTPAATGDVLRDSGNNTAPGSRPIYQNGPNSYSDVQTPGSTPYESSNPIRSQGVGNPTGYDNADPFGLANGQGPGRMGVGGRVGGGSNDPLRRPLSFDYGPRNPNTGRRQMSINHAGPLNGMGPVSGATLGQMADQKRAQLQARRMAGASQGGNVLREISRINKRADKAYIDALNKTHNPRVAREMSEGIRSQADQLVGLDQNNARREGDQLQRDAWGERSNIDAQISAAQLEGASRAETNKMFDQWLDEATTIPDKDGKPVKQPWIKARVQDMMGSYQGPNRSRIARSLISAESVLQNARSRLSTDFSDVSEIFDLQKDGSVKVRGGKIRDLWNTPGFNINDLLSEWLPFGASGDVLYQQLKDGRTVTIPKSAFDEGIPTTPRFQQSVYGER